MFASARGIEYLAASPEVLSPPHTALILIYLSCCSLEQRIRKTMNVEDIIENAGKRPSTDRCRRKRRGDNRRCGLVLPINRHFYRYDGQGYNVANDIKGDCSYSQFEWYRKTRNYVIILLTTEYSQPDYNQTLTGSDNTAPLNSVLFSVSDRLRV